MGPSENRILEEIRNWEKESMDGKHPMTFVSYSYDNDEHRLWVRNLRDRLRADGINAITDESVSGGFPLNLFMEQILNSKQLEFIICVCSTQYAKKADAGVGGVGYEQAIMTRELTKEYGNNKIIPILRENPDGYVPAFLGTKKYLDFRKDKDFNSTYRELTGDIFRIPKMPPLGPRPKWITEKLSLLNRKNSHKNKDKRSKIAERDEIEKYLQRIPNDVISVFILAKESQGVIYMVNAYLNSLPRIMVIGERSIENDSSERIIAYLLRIGFITSLHKDWRTETFILTNRAYDFIEKAEKYKLI